MIKNLNENQFEEAIQSETPIIRLMQKILLSVLGKWTLTNAGNLLKNSAFLQFRQ